MQPQGVWLQSTRGLAPVPHLLGYDPAFQYLLRMTWENVWSVLRWVLAALVAGFIGQFGKSYAQHLLRRRRARSEEPQTNAVKEDLPPEVLIERERLAADAKIEKKRAKAEVKRLKKQADAEDNS